MDPDRNIETAMSLDALAPSSLTASQDRVIGDIGATNSAKPVSPAPDYNATLLATILAFAISSVVFATLYILVQNPSQPLNFDGTPYLGYYVTWQSRTHEAIVAVTSILCLCILLVPGCTRSLRIFSATTKTVISSALMFAAALTLLAAVWYFPRITASVTPGVIFWSKQYGLRAVLTPLQSYIAGVIFTTYLLACTTVGTIKNSKLIWGAILLYAALLVIPGMIFPLRVDSLLPGQIENTLYHYSAIFNTKTILVSGQQPADLGYGIGWNVFFAIIEKMFGPFSWNDDIRFVQTGNIAYAALTLLTLFVWLRGRPLIALAVSLLVLPWVQTLHMGIFFPNQSGFRFIFFPIAFLALGLMRNTPPLIRAGVLGSLCGFAALWNFETGLVLSGGLIVYLFVLIPVRSLRTVALTSTLFFAGVLLAGVIFELVIYAAFGFVIGPTIFANHGAGRFDAVRYYGEPLTPDPAIIAGFAFSLWFLFYGAAVRSNRLVSVEIAEGMALATVLILWAGYYLVEPTQWDLWSYLLPLSLLAAVAWPALAAAGRGSWLSFATGLAAVVVVGMTAGPLIYGNQLQSFASVYSFVGKDNPPASTLISGVYGNPTDREDIEARLAGLSDVPSNCLIFSGDAYLLAKLSKLPNKSSSFWVRDPAYVLQTQGEFKELIRQVIARRPDEILFDKAEDEAAGNPNRPYFALMRASLAGDYVMSNDRKGWTVLRRRDL